MVLLAVEATALSTLLLAKFDRRAVLGRYGRYLVYAVAFLLCSTLVLYPEPNARDLFLSVAARTGDYPLLTGARILRFAAFLLGFFGVDLAFEAHGIEATSTTTARNHREKARRSTSE